MRLLAVGGAKVSCETCGEYLIEDRVGHLAGTKRGGCLAVVARESYDAKSPLVITCENQDDLAARVENPTLATKRQKLLEFFRGRTTFYGDRVAFDPAVQWPMMRAFRAGEAVRLVLDAQAEGLIDYADFEKHGILKAKGWEATDPSAGAVQGLGFAAMSFAPDLLPAYHAMKRAVEEDCGLRLVRVDDHEHFGEKICDRIVAEIRRSQFVIADFTHQRGGVYFEVGYALALGRIVIWTCREDDINNVHFDTRQYPHLTWREPDELRQNLRDRVRALVPGARGEA